MGAGDWGAGMMHPGRPGAKGAFGRPMVRSTRLSYARAWRRVWTHGIQDRATALNTDAVAKSASRQLVVCVDNEGYPASLEKRKLYVMLRDPAAEKHGFVRIIDESGDDYLYPKALFRPVALPQSVKKAVLSAA